MKIIFDRSAFHRERFDLLKNSSLSQLVQERKILVYHTSVFLDETLRRQGAKEELRRQWPFLCSICNGGWFKPLLLGKPPKVRSVCDEELDGGDKDDNWPLVPSSCRTDIEAKVNRFLEGSGPLPELVQAQPIYNQNEQKKSDNKALRLELRTGKCQDTGMGDTSETERKDETFLEYYRSRRVEAAWYFIHRPVLDPLQFKLDPLTQPEVKLDAWVRDPQKFPHFTAFVGFFLYSLYDAKQNQNPQPPLDPNWQADAEQLCFLVDVDAVIARDKFMKRAFEALWQPSQKRIFTPEEFVETLT